MTQSRHDKVLKQIGNKPGKVAKYMKHNVPKERKYGKRAKACQVSGATRGVIHQYGLNICRKLFRRNAKKFGFKQYR